MSKFCLLNYFFKLHETKYYCPFINFSLTLVTYFNSLKLFPDSSGISSRNLTVGTDNLSLLHFHGVAVTMNENQFCSESQSPQYSYIIYHMTSMCRILFPDRMRIEEKGAINYVKYRSSITCS